MFKTVLSVSSADNIIYCSCHQFSFQRALGTCLFLLKLDLTFEVGTKRLAFQLLCKAMKISLHEGVEYFLCVFFKGISNFLTSFKSFRGWSFQKLLFESVWKINC